MGPNDKDGKNDGTDWERYAAELSEAWDGRDWPITPDPPTVPAKGPRDWEQGELEDEQAEYADKVLDSTYAAQDGPPASTLEKSLLAIAGIGLLLIILSEVSVLSLSPTLFIVVVIATAGAAVAWVVAFATARYGNDDGMQV